MAAKRIRRGTGREEPGAEILRQRLARGDIDLTDYQRRLAVLSEATGGRRRGRGRPRALTLAVTAAVLVVGLSAAMAVAAARVTPSGGPRAGATCRVPPLAGHTVSVTLADMGAMMGGGPMMGGYHPGWRPSGQRPWMRMMAIAASPATVPAGVVSFQVRNAGSLVHELVILPLPPGGAGTRPTGADGTVDERGSLGEASASCAAGAGAGIAAGAAGWVTLRLAPGRYELLCNRPGHYGAGMFTELDVT